MKYKDQITLKTNCLEPRTGWRRLQSLIMKAIILYTEIKCTGEAMSSQTPTRGKGISIGVSQSEININ